MSFHECPGGNCRSRVSGARLACPSCWYKLPPAMRREIWTAYGERSTVGPGRHLEAIRAAVQWYRKNT